MTYSIKIAMRIPLAALLLALVLAPSVTMGGEDPNDFSKGNYPNNSNVALILKVVREVQTKRGDDGWKKVDRGYSLNSGDLVQTKDASFSILKFVDGTIVRVQENSELVVRGEKNKSGQMEQKGVELNAGRLGFEVKKRPGEQFRFSSPTSVASIKGTSGMFSMQSGRGTMLLITEGLAELESTTGKKEKKEVGPGQIGIVNQDGSVTVRQATKEELALATSISKGGDRVKINFRDKSGTIRDVEVPIAPEKK